MMEGWPHPSVPSHGHAQTKLDPILGTALGPAYEVGVRSPVLSLEAVGS
jgi:hypothetical protein